MCGVRGMCGQCMCCEVSVCVYMLCVVCFMERGIWMVCVVCV